MAHDVIVLGATVAGLTAARRLAADGFDIVVLDPNPGELSAAVGHGLVACAHSSTVASMLGVYGVEAAIEHVRRNLVGIETIQQVIASDDLTSQDMALHDYSLGAALERELGEIVGVISEAGAKVRPLQVAERSRAGAGLLSEAICVDPRDYANALERQARAAGARIIHEVTVTNLRRRDGFTVVEYRDNIAWSREQESVLGVAVIDTLGVSPWGRIAGVGPAQFVPVVRAKGVVDPGVVTLLPGPPAWLIRPDSQESLILGPKCALGAIERNTDDMVRWVSSEWGLEVISAGRMAIDPSDYGRPVVGASAIPGGFYARGNGRGELMNGTASGTYLASVLLGTERVALPLASKAKAQLRYLFGRFPGGQGA